MKRLFVLSMMSLFILTAATSKAQGGEKPKPVSPPAIATQTIGDLTIKIDYSQPSVKGRAIGKDLEPKAGQVWRTGANKATVFEVNKDVKVEGKALPAGKYGLFTLVDGDKWTIIFNKTWDQWGAFKYKDADDALRVTVKSGKADPFAETMTFNIDVKGNVILLWGDNKVQFKVK